MTKFAVNKFCSSDSKKANRKGGERFTVNNVNLCLLLFGLIVFAGLSYLYYINQTATGGFDIKGMEAEIEELSKNNKRLELQVAELQSLSRIEDSKTVSDMVATSHIEYLPPAGSAVASR